MEWPDGLPRDYDDILDALEEGRLTAVIYIPEIDTSYTRTYDVAASSPLRDPDTDDADREKFICLVLRHADWEGREGLRADL